MIIPLVDAIDALLPQTQCKQCGYPACKPYAEAILKGEADINLCLPGGARGVLRLAGLLGRPVKPLAGEEKPKAVASIDENLCIGCTLCIQACPVDAIVGAIKQMHTVVTLWCTGCELCVPVCPVVACITLIHIVKTDANEQCPDHPAVLPEHEKKAADTARARHQFRQQRQAREKAEKAGRLAKAAAGQTTQSDAAAIKRAAIAAAMERARRRATR